MSITSLNPNGSTSLRSFNSSNGFTGQQPWQPASHFRSDDNPNSWIDNSVGESRLYQGFDGSIGIAEKSLGYVIGEQVVGPLIDTVIDTVHYLGMNVLSFAKSIDGALSFPVAEGAPLLSRRSHYVKEVKNTIEETYNHYSEVKNDIKQITKGEADKEVELSKLEKIDKFFEKLKAAWNVINGPMNEHEELVRGELEGSAITLGSAITKLKKVYEKITPLQNHFKLQRQKIHCEAQFESTARSMTELLYKQADIKAQVEKERGRFDINQRYYSNILQELKEHMRREKELRSLCDEKKALAQLSSMTGHRTAASALSDDILICESELDQIGEAAREDKISGERYHSNMEKANENIERYNDQIKSMQPEYSSLEEKSYNLREKLIQIYYKINENKSELKKRAEANT